MSIIEFQPFPKMARLKRNCFITEKIDGTNAQIAIADRAEVEALNSSEVLLSAGVIILDDLIIRAGSRNRWISRDDDNFGFAGWVYENAAELSKLGFGNHFGEWWGAGIGRKYGRSGQNAKSFSLFNAGRWNAENKPACCEVVPILYEGLFSTDIVEKTVQSLRENGSTAAPGFMKPEGVIVYHAASRQSFKVTCEKDEMSKQEAEQLEKAK